MVQQRCMGFVVRGECECLRVDEGAACGPGNPVTSLLHQPFFMKVRHASECKKSGSVQRNSFSWTARMFVLQSSNLDC